MYYNILTEVNTLANAKHYIAVNFRDYKNVTVQPLQSLKPCILTVKNKFAKTLRNKNKIDKEINSCVENCCYILYN